MLFRITEQDVFEDNPHLKAMKEFKGIQDAQFRYVAFYADWLSPYRNLSEEERRMRAEERAGMYISLESVKTFISAYYDIQGIKHLRNSLDALDKACSKAMDKLQDEEVTDADDLKKYSSTLATLTSQKFEFMKMINTHMNVTEQDIIGEDAMSTADEINV